jgi:hypothetical protein
MQTLQPDSAFYAKLLRHPLSNTCAGVLIAICCASCGNGGGSDGGTTATTVGSGASPSTAASTPAASGMGSTGGTTTPATTPAAPTTAAPATPTTGGNGTSSPVTPSVPTPLVYATDVLMHHNDLARTGRMLAETTLTPANVLAATFGKLRFLPADGKVDGQPLYVTNLSIGGTAHNVV